MNPQVLILNEKHGDRYFLVKTEKDLHDIALKVVTQRFKDGYWYYYDDELPELPEISKEQIAQLKDGNVKRALQQAWDSYDYALRFCEDGKKEQLFLKNLLDKQDGVAAWKFLRHRRGHQYEGYQLEAFETV